MKRRKGVLYAVSCMSVGWRIGEIINERRAAKLMGVTACNRLNEMTE